MPFVRLQHWFRAGAGAACALAAVVAIYTGPLALIGGMDHREAPRFEGIATAPSPRPVVWVPPEPPAAPSGEEEEDEVADGAPAAVGPLAVPAAPDAEPRVVVAPEDVSAGPSRREIALRRFRARRAAARRRAVAHRRTPRPPVDLDTPYITPKGKETKRCAALIDDVVQVDEREWVVSRELVNCYTTHLNQFDHMAYTVWKDHDEKDRHEGVYVRPSRGPDGDVARAAGLERGDVVLSIAGVRIRSWSAVGLLAPRLAMNGRVRVRVRRDGEVVVLTYRVRNDRGVARAREAAGPEVTDAEAQRHGGR